MKRSVTAFEQSEAKLVFGTSIDFARVMIIEDASWPDSVARVAAQLSGSQPPSHNAITLGNRMYFPLELRTNKQPFDSGAVSDMAWLVHELTHVWQYQHRGPVYLLQAVWAQITLGPEAYSYGWEQGLRQAQLEGKSLADFNREQQGEIARHFYFRSRNDQDTSAWEPFAAQFRIAV
jgi:hypothetical protein